MNILYLHGYGSSGQNSTVLFLKKHLSNDNIIAPDIPVDPFIALPVLKNLCEKTHIDVVIGTSMGAQYAQQLYMCDYRICVNPAFHISEKTDVLKIGTFKFFQPRMDGSEYFTITEEIISHYKKAEKHQFDEWIPNNPKNRQCCGLFGTNDTLVNGKDEFLRYYDKVYDFTGGHRLEKNVIKNHIFPLIESIRNNTWDKISYNK